MSALNGTPNADDLIAGPGDETINGPAGFNTVVYGGSEYDYIIARQDDGTVTVRALAGTPFEGDGTDQLINVQSIRFLDSASDRLIDDTSNVQATTNRTVAFGEQVTGQTFRNDHDWYRLTGGTANQAVMIALSGGDHHTFLTDSNISLQSWNAYLGALGTTALDGAGSLSLNVYNTTLPLNVISPYSFTVLRPLDGTHAADTLEAGNVAEYLDGKAGHDSLIGSARSDYLLGGLGSDTLDGAGGNDTLVGGDEADDRDVALFGGRFAEYKISAHTNNWWLPQSWSVTGPQGVTYLTGIEVLRFADRDYVIDEYDTLTATDVSGRPGYAQLGTQIRGRLAFNEDEDWIAFDFGRRVVDGSTSLRISATVHDGATAGKSIYLVNGTGYRLQFTDLADGVTKNSLEWGWSRDFLIKGVQWGEHGEGGSFGGGLAFLVLDGGGGYWSYADPDEGSYTIRISRYRQGTAASDTLTTDGETEPQRAEELAGLGGNDTLTGTARDESFDGGAGNDRVFAGGGHDILRGGPGADTLYGEAGNDTLIVTGETTVRDVLDGGEGADILRVETTANLTGATITSIERLEGVGAPRVTLGANLPIGLTVADGVILTGSNLPYAALGGAYTLEGTRGDDILQAGDGDNVIRSFAGADTVEAGAGHDTLSWGVGAGPDWDLQWRADHLLSSRYSDNVHFIEGSFDGGTGTDALEFVLDNHLYHSWGWTHGTPDRRYALDLTSARIANFEQLRVVTGSYTRDGESYSWGPESVALTAPQIAGLQLLRGADFVAKGGGQVNLAGIRLESQATLSFSGHDAFHVTGSANAEAITTHGGADTIFAAAGHDTISAGGGQNYVEAGEGDDLIILSGTTTVTDTLDGGAGNDTLRITGGDVDISTASLAGIERIEALSASLTLTDAQYEFFGGSLTGSAGLLLKMTSPGTVDVAALPNGFVGIRGSAGHDTLLGSAQADVLAGGDGDDSLSGGAGNDRLLGGAGRDILRGGEGNDTLAFEGTATPLGVADGGAGIDQLHVADGMDLSGLSIVALEQLIGQGQVTLTPAQLASFQLVSGVQVRVTGGGALHLGAAALADGASASLGLTDAPLVGRAGLLGSAQDDTLMGGGAGDQLLGGRGADSLVGDDGADTLIGGSGVDTLVGGNGDDLFLVEADEFGGSYGFAVRSDLLSGGGGNDTLQVNFGTGNSPIFTIAPGSLQGIETLRIQQLHPRGARLSLDAESLRKLSTIEIDINSTWHSGHAALIIEGDGRDLSLQAITPGTVLHYIDLRGPHAKVDVAGLTANTSVYGTALDGIALGLGHDVLTVRYDTRFDVQGGAGNDTINVLSVGSYAGTIDGGSGTDLLVLGDANLTDISAADLRSVETVRHGSTTLVVTAAQLNDLSFEGDGAKFVRSGGLITGSAAADTYQGSGVGSFQGGGGDDNISHVHTAVFGGNFADYDFVRSGWTMTIEHARGSLADGRDTLGHVMQAKFADTTLTLDDAPDGFWVPYNAADLTVAEYGKRISAKKDFAADLDLFRAELVPNSPLVIEASSQSGAGWNVEMRDAASGQQIAFRNGVNNGVHWRYESWFNPADKWVPVVQVDGVWKPYAGGDVRLLFNSHAAGQQDYAFTLKYLDDLAGSVDTDGAIDPVVGEIRGYIGDLGDTDWVRTNLIGGTRYEFSLKGLASGDGTLVDPKLELRDALGRLIETGVDTQTNTVGGNDTLIFRPTASGTYYLAAADVGGFATGSWTLTQRSLDTIAGNVSTGERIEWSAGRTFSVASEINAFSDRDWFKIWLDRGLTYSFRETGSGGGGGTLADPQLSLRSATGILLAQDDNSGGGSDARVVFRAPDSGWYFLDAGASGNATRGTYTLSGATLADDYANSAQTTGSVLVGTPAQGLISFQGDSDWFRTGLSAGQTYVITVTGDTSDSAQLDPLMDPLLTVRDATGQALLRADDFGGSLDARAYFTPTQNGQYFLDVRSAFLYDTGAYSISLSFAPADDFADTVEQAVEAPATAGALSLGTSLTGSIGTPGDHDIFQLALEAGRVYQFRADGLASHVGTLADPYLRLFDANGKLLDYSNDGGIGREALFHFAPVITGTYYLEVSANADRGLGAYRVSAVQRDLPPDDVPNDLSTGITLAPGDSFTGDLLTHGDQDWFRIDLRAAETYVLRLRGLDSGGGSLPDPVLEVRASDGSLVRSLDNMLFSRDAAMAITPNATGTYFVVVRGADAQRDTGSYTLVTRAPDDHGDNRAEARILVRDLALDGAIQWNDGAFGIRAHDSLGLATDADEDWFSVTAAAGEVLSVTAAPAAGSGLTRLLVEIVDPSGRTVAVGDGLEAGQGAAQAAFRAAESGLYYARVMDAAGTTGAYTMRVTAGDVTDEDAAAPVQMLFSGDSVRAAEAKGRIGLAGDVDTFTAAVTAGHQYRIETIALRNGLDAPLPSATLAVGLVAAGGAEINVPLIRDAQRPSLFDTTVLTPTSDGSVRLSVSAADPTDVGAFKIRIVDLGGGTADDRPDTVAQYEDTLHGVTAANEVASGRLDHAGDSDLFAINLTSGNAYSFSLKGYADGLGSLAEGSLQLRDANGLLISSGRYDANQGRTDLAISVFESGRYYVAVGGGSASGLGTYTLDTRLLGGASSQADDIRGDTRSGAVVRPGAPVTGRIEEAGDSDWIRASLVSDKVYVADVLGNGAALSGAAGGTLANSTLRLLSASGEELRIDHDSGAGLDARLLLTVPVAGEYYLDVRGEGAATGTYTLRLRELYSGTADPLVSAQWYLDALGLDRLKDGASGAGITIGVIDDGIDPNHPDLKSRLDGGRDYDAQFDTLNGSHKFPLEAHGTPVAGIIAAEANNETGIRGIAPDSQIAATRVSWTFGDITDALSRQHLFEISNNSWGATTPFADNFNSTSLTFAHQALRKGVEDGRDGLGTVFVFSAGNSAGYGDNTNYHNFQNAREVITVGAANPNGTAAAFSTPGANVFVGTYGVDLLTTDRIAPGLGYNESGDYTFFSGTSAAAPVVSGVVALMLEANPLLGYRDVQEILALSATHPDGMDWKVNGATSWNLGGLRFNDQLGFGLVDAYAAVQLAETWAEQDTAADEVSASARAFGLAAAIPDGEGEYRRSFRIDNSLEIERVELGIDLRHTRLGDLTIDLTSPSGTVSRLLDRPTANAERPFGLSGEDSGVPLRLLWDLSSTQFWGEQSAGDWIVTVRDLRAEETGTLSSLSLRLYGSPDDGDDTYVFTPEGFLVASERLLQDETGADTINGAALVEDTFIDLAAGLIASAGTTHRFAGWTVIEAAIGGAGDDRIDGNSEANHLMGRAGDDTLEGGAGNDTLDGGAGWNTAVFGGKRAEYGISYDPAGRTVLVVDNLLSNGNEGSDVLSNIARIVFSDAEMSLGPLVGNSAPIASVSLFSSPVFVGRGMGINFELPEGAFTDPDGTDDLGVTVTTASGDDLPAWLSFDPATNTFTGVPPEGLQGQVKLLVEAIDSYGAAASGTLTLQFGDNQAPVVESVRELVLQEDAGNTALAIPAPLDPEGTAVSVTLKRLPNFGDLLHASGVQAAAGDILSPAELAALHYRAPADANGFAGSILYEARDADGVSAEGSVRIFVTPENDAPRFGPDSALAIQYPAQQDVPLDLAVPSDPESSLTQVTVVQLPALGVVTRNGAPLSVGAELGLAELGSLRFSLNENVNGPIGELGLRATDPEGLSSTWRLSLSVNGEPSSSNGTTNRDALYGSIGADTLYGLGGDDTIAGNAGNDRLLGGPGHDILLGGSGNDLLDGSSGSDRLDGGSGIDTMAGGPGDDTYVVDEAGDQVIEALARGAGGIDTIETRITYTAPENVEHLLATGDLAINLTGNELANRLVGNATFNVLRGLAGHDTLLGLGGSDTLDGGSGIDQMAGGAGNDLYRVDSRSDLVFELAGEGEDTVEAACTFTLPTHVENLTLLEGGDYGGGGNALANLIIGNSGANILSGGLGADTLSGGLGDDVYVLTDLLDLIIDAGGTDTVRTSLSFVLPNDIERLELIGLTNAAGQGNALANVLVGNPGSNELDGGFGADTLTGGLGGDAFFLSFNGPSVQLDRVTDFTPGEDLAMIDLASFGFGVTTLGFLSSGTVAAQSFVRGPGVRPLDPNDFFLFDTAQHLLSIDPDGSGSREAIPIAYLSGSNVSLLGASDLYVLI